MKKLLTIFSIIIVASLIFAIAYSADFAEDNGTEVSTNKYYTWGITSDFISKNISEGEIFTEVKLIFKNITNTAENSSDVLYIHLVDKPPIGVISNTDQDPNSDFFSPNPSSILGMKRGIATTINSSFSPALTPPYQDTKIGKEDLIYTLGNIDNPDSWTWKIFEKPFVFQIDSNDPNKTVEFSSSLLEFIDFTGNGDTVGLGIDPTGQNSFTFDEIIIELTIERYEGVHEKRVVPIRISRPPVIIE